MGQAMIQVRERKLWPTIGMVFMLAWPPSVFIFLWYVSVQAGGIDSATMIALSVVLSIPSLLAIAFYRLPRGLELYPQEQIARRYRGVLHWKWFGRWHDLSDAPPKVERSHYVEKQSVDNAGGALVALGCLFALMGPLGLLLSLGLQKKREVRVPVYVLSTGRGMPPMMVLDQRKTAARAVALYEALQTGTGSDLNSDSVS